MWLRCLPHAIRAPLSAVRCVMVLATGLVVSLHLFGMFPIRGWHPDTYLLDLEVYRLGGQAWLQGSPLYEALLRPSMRAAVVMLDA